MPTDLTKSVMRRTRATCWSQGRPREIIISIEPAGADSVLLGFRLSGTRQTFYLTAQSAFRFAVEAHNAANRRRRKA